MQINSQTVKIAAPKHNGLPCTWHKSLDLLKPGPLSQSQLLSFKTYGFLKIPSLIPLTAITTAQKAIDSIQNDFFQRLYKRNLITNLHLDATWEKRLVLIEKQFPGTSVLLHKLGVFPKGLQQLHENKELLDVMSQQGLGPHIAAHSVWNVRTKIPSHSETVVPWHQDNSYLPEDFWHEKIIGCWIPLVRATKENGCMQYVKEGGIKGRTLRHTVPEGNTWYTQQSESEMMNSLDINEKDFNENSIETLECELGDCIIFTMSSPHRSISNRSDHVRWSLDYRFQNVNYQREKPLDAMFGLKDSCIIRKEDEEGFVADWSEYAGKNRQSLNHNEEGVDKVGLGEDSEFDTIITGPWMDMWDIVDQENRHIKAHLKGKKVA